MSNFNNAFCKYTTYYREDGRYFIKCNLGLWLVSANTYEQAYLEARHYFYQYFVDGEYNINLPVKEGATNE